MDFELRGYDNCLGASNQTDDSWIALPGYSYYKMAQGRTELKLIWVLT